MNPAKEVGGDFYDFFFVDDKHLALVMADVSGKGVPAALFMVIAKVLIKNRMQRGDTPAEALKNVNNQLCEGNESNLFVTVWLALIDLETGEGLATNAGHEHPVLKRKDGEFEIIKYKHSPAVAIMEDMSFEEHSFQINPGDCIFVYTDGVTEAQNNNDELFGEERMQSALNKYKDCNIEDIILGMKQSIDDFADGATQFDDITMLAFIFKDYYNKGEN
jgi:sigma-B regulation protein RsbU (phosphoserine phosphatase)